MPGGPLVLTPEVVTWKLTRISDGDSRTLEGWSIRSAVLSLVNQGLDTLTLGFGATDLLGNSFFADGEILRLDRVVEDPPGTFGATTVFRGRKLGDMRGAYGSSEGLVVVVAGAWWYLANLIYMRTEDFVADGTVNPAPVAPETQLGPSDFVTVRKTTSQVVIKEDQIGTPVDSAGQVADAVAYAIAKGAPIQVGTIDAGIPIPRDSVTDSPCSEMIARALRWTPDQSVFFDYSFNPPKLNIRTRANRTALALDIADEIIAEIEINPRSDLVVPGVTLNYIAKHSRTGIEFTTLTKDAAGPDPEGIGALVLTVELYGSFLTTTIVGATSSLTVVAAEAVPVGIAAALYAAYSVTPYEGRILLVLDECLALQWIGKKISVANGVPIWTTAEMIVQQSSEDLFAGRTELTVGPPRQLGAQDLLGLVRKGRTVPPPLTDNLGPITPSPPDPDIPPPTSTDPRLQFGGQNPPLVIGKHHHGQNVGYPNSYGLFYSDEILVQDVSGGIWHATGPPAHGTIINFHGVTIGGLNRYVSAADNIHAGARNDAWLPNSGPSFRVLSYTNPPVVT